MTPQTFTTDAGSLAFRTFAGSGKEFVCLHGFTLHGGMFATLAQHAVRPILAPDLPGHGATQINPVDLETTLDVLAAWLGHADAPHDVLGYSQGGRIALHLAARHPRLVGRLILVSSSTGLSEEARRGRKLADDRLADQIEAVGLDGFLDEWLTHPLVGTHRLDAAVAAADRRLREENTVVGLAAALRGLGQGTVPEVDVTLLQAPTLWLAGGRDQRYSAAALGQSASGHGDVHIVPGAGHNLVLEAPATVAAIVDEWLSRSP